jgi:predicted NACHT family NTPase
MPSRKRFWCNRGATYHLADGGYLLDPDSPSTKYLQRDAFSIQEVFQKPCVALLGEPGIGKSTALSASIADMKAGVESTGNWLLNLDLKEFSTDDRLERHLIESPKFKEWATGTGVLHLFLDSLDEW